ncbi:cytochrome P450 [Sphingomonas sp.]|uniref:cytochrome P450 n=1 Tax=Sphingomonas sp. TaxID=28214 RepID=UPI003B3A6FE0
MDGAKQESSTDYEDELASLPIDQLDVARPQLFQRGYAPRYLRRLRHEAPVHYCADGEYASYWSVTRHRDIEMIELDTDTFSSDHLNGGITLTSHPDDPQFLPSFIAMDPPRHGEQRKVIAPAFSPQRLGEMTQSLRTWSREILDGLPIGTTFDWVDRVSIELTARTLALLLGYPHERARDLIRWSDAMVALPGSPACPTIEQKLAVMQECFDAFDQIWQARLRAPAGNDLLSMIAGGVETRELSPDELHGNLLLLIVGGNDTTRNSITASVLALDRFPRERQKLDADPKRLANLVPEILRWQTPIAHMRRTAMRDVVLGGQPIAKGDKVILWYLSANHDEEIFADAEDFRIDRANARRHLSFGAGIHRCVGARLADLQIRILWEEILTRFPRINVLHEPERSFSTFTHGYSSLLVRIPHRHS